MRQSVGTAHITVITIILIGIVALVGGMLIPRLVNSVNDKSCCQELGGMVTGNQCVGGEADGSMIKGLADLCS